ncbi:hypothetical protein Tco_1285347 [Tanacetum coccineum]
MNANVQKFNQLVEETLVHRKHKWKQSESNWQEERNRSSGLPNEVRCFWSEDALPIRQAQVENPESTLARRNRLQVTDEVPQHFEEDALPRPPGLQRISKSQRSLNSTASSSSNSLMYQEMIKEQYELDRKASMEDTTEFRPCGGSSSNRGGRSDTDRYAGRSSSTHYSSSESGGVYGKPAYKRENGGSSYTSSATPAPRVAPLSGLETNCGIEKVAITHVPCGILENGTEKKSSPETHGGTLDFLRKELSDSVLAIKELETLFKNLEEDLDIQAHGFEADMEDLIRAKVEQEQRAIRAEDNLRNVKLKNANTAWIV